MLRGWALQVLPHVPGLAARYQTCTVNLTVLEAATRRPAAQTAQGVEFLGYPRCGDQA